MRLLITLMIFVVLMVIAPPVSAREACGSHDVVIRAFSDKYGEVSIGRGIAFSGAMIELLVSDEGSWSMLIARPGGLVCLFATGTDWEFFPVLPEAPEEERT